jgi:hypothetical protein
MNFIKIITKKVFNFFLLLLDVDVVVVIFISQNEERKNEKVGINIL